MKSSILNKDLGEKQKLLAPRHLAKLTFRRNDLPNPAFTLWVTYPRSQLFASVSFYALIPLGSLLHIETVQKDCLSQLDQV
jgi:hypothetical protein